LDQTKARENELSGIFSEYAKADAQYLSLYLLNEKGIALISTDPSFVGQDYSFRNYYKEGMAGRPAVDMLLGKTSNEFGYYFSHPVFDGNKVIGVFVAKVDSKEINSAILTSEVNRDSTVMLVDEYGIVVTTDVSDRFLKSLGELTPAEMGEIRTSNKFLGREILPLQYEVVQEIVRNDESIQGIEINDEVDGEKEMITVNQIGELPFYLVSETGLERITDTISRTIFILIGLISIALFFSFFVIYRLIMYSLSPLEKLKSLVKSVSEGDFSKRVEVYSKDEFGDLANSFNKMSADLEDIYKNLEKKVAERTVELEKSRQEFSLALEKSEKTNRLMVGRELEMIRLKKELADLKSIK
jgi:C4-dicarboxylate-specific signal transduction histidine kinase